MIKVGSLCEICGKETGFLSFLHILNKTFGYGTSAVLADKTEKPPYEPRGANIDLFITEEEQNAFTKAHTTPDGQSWKLAPMKNTKFMSNGTVGLIVWREGDWTRMLIEDKLYEVPTDKLKEITT